MFNLRTFILFLLIVICLGKFEVALSQDKWSHGNYMIPTFDAEFITNSDYVFYALYPDTSNHNPMSEKVIDIISSSGLGDQLSLAMYGLNWPEFVDELINAHARGVIVEVVGDCSSITNHAYSAYYTMLSNAGIPVVSGSCPRSGIQHNKFIVVSDADGIPHTVVTGTANFTTTGFFYNFNNILVYNSEDIALIYKNEFDEMFAGNFGRSKSSNPVNVVDFADGVRVEIYFSPPEGSDAKERFLDIVGNTEDFLFNIFYMTDDDIGDALVDLQRSTGNVNGIWEAGAFWNRYSEGTNIVGAGSDVVVEINGGKEHQKSFVAMDHIDLDGRECVISTGSANWSANALANNDENWNFIFGNVALCEQYANGFWRVYNEFPSFTYGSYRDAESGIPSCGDGIDNNFRGGIDADDSSCAESTVELCTNHMDDDGDGDIDINDEDCYFMTKFCEDSVPEVPFLFPPHIREELEQLEIWWEIPTKDVEGWHVPSTSRYNLYRSTLVSPSPDDWEHVGETYGPYMTDDMPAGNFVQFMLTADSCIENDTDTIDSTIRVGWFEIPITVFVD